VSLCNWLSHRSSHSTVEADHWVKKPQRSPSRVSASRWRCCSPTSRARWSY